MTCLKHLANGIVAVSCDAIFVYFMPIAGSIQAEAMAAAETVRETEPLMSASLNILPTTLVVLLLLIGIIGAYTSVLVADTILEYLLYEHNMRKDSL